MKKRYSDVREPIEYVVDQYFNRKRLNLANESDPNEFDSSYVGELMPGQFDDTLPTHPVTIIRGEDNKVNRVIYGEVSGLTDTEEHSYIIWQEELIRDDDGKVITIRTTYPDGEMVDNHIIRRASDGKVERYE